MPFGNIQNYEGSGVIDRIELGQNLWIKAYNNQAAAATYTNGDVVVLSGLSANSGEAANTKYPTIVVPATSATPVTVRVGVVDNTVAGLATIGALSWGWVQIRGYCNAVTKTTTANPIAIDDYVKAMNGVKTAATDGTSGSTAFSQKSFGVAKSVVATGVAGTFTCYLFGDPVTI